MSSSVSNGVPNNTLASVNGYSAPNNGYIHAQSAVNLAAIQIPQFNGTYTEWAPFEYLIYINMTYFWL